MSLPSKLPGPGFPHPPVAGEIDSVSLETGISGWALFPDEPLERVHISIYIGSSIVAEVYTSDLRTDFTERFGFPVFCGFNVDVWDHY